MTNIESILIAYLADALNVPCYAQPIDPRPDTFITVERAGGAHGLFKDVSTITVQWWADTVENASELCAVGNTLIFGLQFNTDYPQICKVVASTSPRYLDVDSGQARYQTTFEITITL